MSALACAVAAAVVTGGCGIGREAAARAAMADFGAHVAAGGYSAGEATDGGGETLRFAAEPWLDWTVRGRESRAVVLTTGGGWRWRVSVPAGGRLRGGVQWAPAAEPPEPGADEAEAVSEPVDGEPATTEAPEEDEPGGPAAGSVEDRGGVQATLSLVDGSASHVLDVLRLSAEHEWRQLDVDLAAWSGREVELVLEPRTWGPGEEAGQGVAADLPATLAWSSLRVAAPAAAVGGGGPPNVLLVVVDTLRRDRVSAYADARETTPQIRRLLGDSGVTFERAYAQASWTVPSVASYLTGRYPHRVIQQSSRGPVLSTHTPTLAQILRDAGYRTAALAANPVLQPLGGYGRGFESYSVVGVDEGWEALRAEELTDRALDWLRDNGDEKFFLYLHYIDPHSPYSPPGPGEEPQTDATGFPLSAVDDLRWGKVTLADPEADLPRIEELYDREVRAIDAAVARLIGELSDEQLAETLIVLTSDHGEELRDHGWWGHQRTLYDEIIRIPLLMRWDGRLPAGGRVAGVVRLLDLLPTLVEAAGGNPPPRLDGISLWPALLAGAEPPRLTADASQVSWGVERAAAVRDGVKLMLFNHASPGDGEGERFDFTVSLDRRLLERVEIYDVAADPAERRNLAADRSATVDRRAEDAMAALLHRRLGEQLDGLRIVARDLPAGSQLALRLRCEPAPERVVAYFLAPDDRLDARRSRIELELAAGAVAKGAVVPEGCERFEVLSAELSGGGEAAAGAPASLTIRIGGRPWLGGQVSRAETVLQVPWPAPPGGPTLDLWHSSPRRSEPVSISDEALRRLLALGYAAP